MKRIATLILLGSLFACGQSSAEKAQQAAAADTIVLLRDHLDQMRVVAAQQDSVLLGVQESTALLDQIEQEISKVRNLRVPARRASAGEGPADPRLAARDQLLEKVQEVTRLLAANRARVRALSGQNDSLNTRVTMFEETLASLEGMVSRQRFEILALTETVDSLRTQNVRVASERDEALDTAATLRRENNTVFYVVGTKEELVRRGIIVSEGSRRFVLFGGKPLAPARTLDTSAFTAIDKFAQLDIPLRSAGRPYSIISRHDAGLVEVVPAVDGNGGGQLHIKSPTQFWGASRYLIIVQS